MFKICLNQFLTIFLRQIFRCHNDTIACDFFGVTSQGEAHDHKGELVDDKTLELSLKGHRGKEDLQNKITVNWVNADQIEVKEADYSGREVKLGAAYVFKRKKS